MISAVRLIGLRHSRRHPARTVLAVLAIGAGSSLLVAVIVVLSSLQHSFASVGRQISTKAPLRVMSTVSRGGISADQAAAIERMPDVGTALPVIEAITLIDRPDGDPVPVFAVGVDCRIERVVGQLQCSPDAVARARDVDPPYVSARLARLVGKDSSIRSDHGTHSLRGAVAVPKLDTLNEGRVVLYPLPVGQRLFDRADQFDVVFVKPRPGVSAQRLRHELTAALGPGLAVVPAGDPPPSAVLASQAFVPLFSLLGLFALGIGGLVVHSTVALAFEERRRQFALASTFGCSERVLGAVLVSEAAVTGLLGGIVGAVGALVIAHPLTAALSHLTERITGIRVTVHPSAFSMLVAVSVAVVASVLAAAPLVRRLRQLDVVAQLRDGADDAEVTSPRLYTPIFAVAIALAAVDVAYLVQRHGALTSWEALAGETALVVVVVALLVGASWLAPVVLHLAARVPRGGPRVRLAVTNLVRSPRRTAAMAGAVATATAIGCVLASAATSIRAASIDVQRRSVAGRVLVSAVDPNAYQSFNIEARPEPALIARVRELPGVQTVDRRAYLLSGTSGADLVGVVGEDHPTAPYRPFTLATGADAVPGPDGAMVGAALARKRGLRPGRDLRLPTHAGIAVIHVKGVWADPTFNGDAVTMPLSTMEGLWGPQPASQLLVRPLPGVRLAALAERVRSVVGLPTRVYTQAEVGEAVGADITDQLAPFRALQQGMLLVALITVATTLVLVAAQRRREYGVLSAVALEPRDLAAMTLLEGGIVAVVGSVLGAIASVGMIEALREVSVDLFGLRPALVLDWRSPLLYGALGVLVALLGAALPAAQAARLDLMEALQYE